MIPKLYTSTFLLYLLNLSPLFGKTSGAIHRRLPALHVIHESTENVSCDEYEFNVSPLVVPVRSLIFVPVPFLLAL